MRVTHVYESEQPTLDEQRDWLAQHCDALITRREHQADVLDPHRLKAKFGASIETTDPNNGQFAAFSVPDPQATSKPATTWVSVVDKAATEYMYRHVSKYKATIREIARARAALARIDAQLVKSRLTSMRDQETAVTQPVAGNVPKEVEIKNKSGKVLAKLTNPYWVMTSDKYTGSPVNCPLFPTNQAMKFLMVNDALKAAGYSRGFDVIYGGKADGATSFICLTNDNVVVWKKFVPGKHLGAHGYLNTVYINGRRYRMHTLEQKSSQELEDLFKEILL